MSLHPSAANASSVARLDETHLRNRPLQILLVLAASCFTSAMIVRIADPLVPEIARDLLVAPGTAALLASAFAFPYALGQPILGPLGDALGKARIIKGCLLMLAIALALTAIAPTIETLFAARILAGLAGGGTIPLAIATIGDRFAMAERQVALSRLLSAMLIGQIVGVVGSGYIGSLVSWRWVMAIASLCVVGSLILALRYLEARPDAERKPFSFASMRDGYAQVFANPRAKVCYAAVFMGGLFILGLTPYLAVILEFRGAGGLREAGYVLAGLGLGGVLFTVLVAWMLRALGGQMNMIRAGGIIAALGLAAYATSATWPLAALAFVATGLGFYMVHNSLQTQATELAPAARGAAVALHAFFFFLGQAFGPVYYALGFNIFGQLSPVPVFAAGLVMAGLGFVVARLLARPLPAVATA
jgi:predicted MFS family arabinose efflux permease